MEFEIGSIADLISGSRTPHRAKAVQKPLTPRKKDWVDTNTTPQNKPKTSLKKPKLVFTPENHKKALSKLKSARSRNILLGGDKTPGKNRRENKALENRVDKNNDDEAYESSESNKMRNASKKSGHKSANKSSGKKRTQKSSEAVKKKIRKIEGDVDDSSSSEHESDNELSELESDIQLSKDLEAEFPPSDDEDGNDGTDKRSDFQKAAELRQQQTLNRLEKYGEEEANRTIFVGNVPISKKCKKDIKKIFAQHGVIESVRIRGVPVKHMNSNPKVAIIKNEIHPDRSTVIVYVKFKDASSVEKALVENNRLLGENHIRVSKSNVGHSIHDTRKTIFVGNLPHTVEDEDLRNIFIKCGDIASVRVIREKKTQIGKGFGYVNFEKSDGVELALSLSDEELTLKKRILRVRRYTQSVNKQKTLGKFQKQMPGKKFQNSNHQNKGARQMKHSRNQNKPPLTQHNKSSSQFSENKPSKMKKFKKSKDPSEKSEKAQTHFVGFTSEKKKKKKPHKGDQKRKRLSQILMGK